MEPDKIMNNLSKALSAAIKAMAKAKTVSMERVAGYLLEAFGFEVRAA